MLNVPKCYKGYVAGDVAASRKCQDCHYQAECFFETMHEAKELSKALRMPVQEVGRSFECDPNGIDQHAPGAKLDAGKILAGVLEDFSLALTEVARVGTFGAKKYSRGGWMHVSNGIERYNDAKWRHALKGKRESLDPDSGLLHAAHEAWNALAKLELILRQEQDNG